MDNIEADGQNGRSRDAGERFHCIAESALACYPLTDAQCQYLGHSGGVAFRVETFEGRNAYLLKIHTHPRGRRAVLESGLLWLAALAQEMDLTVQKPLRNLQGHLVTEVDVPGKPGETVYCSLVRWIEGEHFPGAPSWRESRAVPCSPQWAARLGKMVARLHRHASGWAPPDGFGRPRYDAARMNGWLRDLYAFVQDGRIAATDYGILEQAAQRIERLMAGLGEGKTYWGLVHADLCPDNYVIYGDEVRQVRARRGVSIWLS